MKAIGYVIALVGLVAAGAGAYMTKTSEQSSLTMAYAAIGLGVVLILVGLVVSQMAGKKAAVVAGEPPVN